jgi:hypothetical protein
VFSQTQSNKVKVFTGKEVKRSPKNKFENIIGSDNNGIYVSRSMLNFFQQRVYTLEHYDRNLKKTKSEKLDLHFKDKKMDFEGFIDLNDKIYVFSSFINQAQKKKYVFTQELNKNTLVPQNNLKKVADFQYEKSRIKHSVSFNHEISDDKSKVLAYFDLPQEKRENEKYGLFVYDSDFNMLWEKDVVLPYSSKLFEISEFKIDNNGNVFVLGKLYEKSINDGNYMFVIISYTENGTLEKKYPLNLSNVFLTDIQITITDNLEIICAGFYSQNTSRSAKGSFYLRFDPTTNSVKSQSFKEFDFDFITQDLSERDSKRKTKQADKGKNVEMNNMYLDDIIMRDDGGAIVIGESFRTHTTKYASTNGQIQYTTQYIYGNIVIVNINPDGSIAWSQKIPKKQTSINDNGILSSYIKKVDDDKIYFIFNDNSKNLHNNQDNKVYSFTGTKKNMTALVQVDFDGTVSKREFLFDFKTENVYIQPLTSVNINDSEIICYALGRKKEKFIKFSF